MVRFCRLFLNYNSQYSSSIAKVNISGVVILYIYIYVLNVCVYNENNEKQRGISGNPIKQRNVEVLIILKRTVQHSADEKGVEQHYSYENVVIELLDVRKPTLIEIYFK